MEKVVTINLGGNPYQFDEPAYAALASYIEGARHALRANPDREEIVADLESAIAQKALAYLNPHKSVVSQAEVMAIVGEMGPIEDEGGDDGPRPDGAGTEKPAPGANQAEPGEAKRRFYRLPHGAMIAGVCNGLGARFGIDPALIRVLFIIAAVASHGFAVIGYIVLMFVIPSPATPEEWAKAHNAPFNAQQVIERAKEEYRDFTWARWPGRRAARRARRAARFARRASRAASFNYAPPPSMERAGASSPPTGPSGAITQSAARLVGVLFGLMSVALLVAFLVTLVSLASTGAILGWTPPGGLPTWALIIIAVFAFIFLSEPLRAIRRIARGALYPQAYGPYGAFDGLVWLALLGLSAWLAYLYLPATHAWFEQAGDWAEQAWQSLRASLSR